MKRIASSGGIGFETIAIFGDGRPVFDFEAQRPGLVGAVGLEAHRGVRRTAVRPTLYLGIFSHGLDLLLDHHVLEPPHLAHLPIRENQL